MCYGSNCKWEIRNSSPERNGGCNKPFNARCPEETYYCTSCHREIDEEHDAEYDSMCENCWHNAQGIPA